MTNTTEQDGLVITVDDEAGILSFDWDNETYPQWHFLRDLGAEGIRKLLLDRCQQALSKHETYQHPITPPPELVQQWINEEDGLTAGHIATQAARWGADMELEKCCEWLVRNYNYPEAGNPIRAARRPKPPSLKEQALTALSHLLSGSAQTLDTTEAEFYIRRALEALPND